MSKLSRTVLKEIVKECIVEIFEESFFGEGNVLSESNARHTKTSKSIKSSSKRPQTSTRQSRHLGQRTSLDTISYAKKDIKGTANESYNRKIDNITNSLTSDPVMAEIFKDTANSTLQTQTSAESSRSRGPSVLSGGDAAALAVHNSDPTELFSESASKWATLAFADSIKK
jgi:hypothetical protein